MSVTIFFLSLLVATKIGCWWEWMQSDVRETEEIGIISDACVCVLLCVIVRKNSFVSWWLWWMNDAFMNYKRPVVCVPFPSATFTFDIWYCLIAFRALICLFLPVPSESTRAECVNVDSVQPNGMLKIGTSKCIVGSFVLSVRLFTFGLWGRWTKHKHIWARLLLSVFIIESNFLNFFALFFYPFPFYASFHTLFLFSPILLWMLLSASICHVTSNFFSSACTSPNTSVCWQQLDLEIVHFARTLPKLGLSPWVRERESVCAYVYQTPVKWGDNKREKNGLEHLNLDAVK